LFYKSAIKISSALSLEPMAGHLADGIESSLPSRNFAGVAMQTTASFEITVCGIEELTQHCEARVSHVASILDPAWPVPATLHSCREHERLELRFDDVIERVPEGASRPAAYAADTIPLRYFNAIRCFFFSKLWAGVALS
jgi:hypothetical protein